MREKDNTDAVTILADLSEGQSPPTRIKVPTNVFKRATEVLMKKHLTPITIAAEVVIFTAAVVGAREVKKALDKKKKTAGPKLTPEQKDRFRELLELYRPRIYSFIARGLWGSPQDVEDLTQKVFEKAYLNYANFIPKRGLDNPEFAWLLKIARNLRANHYRDDSRRTQRIVSMDELEEQGSELFPGNAKQVTSPVEPEAEVDPKKVMLRRKINELPDRYKLVFYLKEIEKLTNREIAYIMGTTEGAIKSLYVRTKRELSLQMRSERIF